MRTFTFEILVYCLVYRALRQKISCVTRAPLVNLHSRHSHTRFARDFLFGIDQIVVYRENPMFCCVSGC